jgi:hypothetical protein
MTIAIFEYAQAVSILLVDDGYGDAKNRSRGSLIAATMDGAWQIVELP